MRSAYRTPSPEKAASDGNRRHSPWTAQRARKKGKNSPDAKPGLPDVYETEMEDSDLMMEGDDQTAFHGIDAKYGLESHILFSEVAGNQ